MARVTEKHDIDLAPFKLTSTELYIEAIGKPMIFSHLSDAIIVP